MSGTAARAGIGAEPRLERHQRWIAACVSALLHVLLLLVLLFASKPTVTTPQGAAGGSRMKVDFVGEPRPAKPGPPSPPPPRTQVRRRPAASPVRSTLVERSEDPLPPEAPDEPVPQPTVPQPPTPESQDEPERRQAQTPATSPPAQRRPKTWTGHPPGFLPQDTAPDNMGASAGIAAEEGNRNDATSAQPSMEVGGYQVYYDTRSETLLRTWKAAGMKELAVPLPGTRYRMVCSLDIAIKRGSGKCRLLYPESPEMQAIGDGREVINMIQVYKQGEVVWRGPGPYR